MVGDSRRTLMVQAAAEGVVDFSRARVLDPQWWSRLHILLHGLAAKNNRHMLQMQYDYHLALLQVERLKAEAWGDHLERAVDTNDDMCDNYNGARNSKKDRKKAVAVKLRDAWIAEFGDTQSAEVAASIDATVAAIEQRRIQGRRKQRGVPIRSVRNN